MPPVAVTPSSPAVSLNSRARCFPPWAVVLALTGLALLLRLAGLESRSLWTDEFHTLIALEKPLPELVRNRLAAGHLPTWFLGMKVWTTMAGTSDWALRFPSAVSGALLVPAAFFCARPFFSWPQIVLLMLVAVTNGGAVWAGQEARMYALLGVTATCAHAAYLRTLTSPRPLAAWLGYYGALTLSVSLQPVMLLWYVAHLAFTFRMRREFPSHARTAFTVALSLVLALVPLAFFFAGAQRKFDGIRFDLASPWMLWTRLTTVAFGPDRDLAGLGYISRAALLAALVAGVVAWRRRMTGDLPSPEPAITRQDQQSGQDLLFPRFCLFVVLVPALLLWVGECLLPDVLGPWRYQIPSSVPLWSLLIWAVFCLPSPGRRRAAIAALLLLTVAGLLAHWRDQGSGIREVAQHLSTRLRPGDVVLHPESDTLARALRRYGVGTQWHLTGLPDAVRKGKENAGEQLERAGGKRVWLVFYRERRREKAQWLERLAGPAGPLQPDAAEPVYQFEAAEARPYRARK